MSDNSYNKKAFVQKEGIAQWLMFLFRIRAKIVNLLVGW